MNSPVIIQGQPVNIPCSSHWEILHLRLTASFNEGNVSSSFADFYWSSTHAAHNNILTHQVQPNLGHLRSNSIYMGQFDTSNIKWPLWSLTFPPYVLPALGMWASQTQGSRVNLLRSVIMYCLEFAIDIMKQLRPVVQKKTPIMQSNLRAIY